MSRWTRFFFVLIIGVGVGLLYGWVISPVEYVDTMPESLRDDYKTDYVLMVAEAYPAEKDLALAVQRLTFLGATSPESIAQLAMDDAVQKDYAPSDLGLLRDLGDALQDWTSNLEGVAP